jgi:hypothetical protein
MSGYLVRWRWKDYFSRPFCEYLDRLALVYGFAAEKKQGAVTGPARSEAP